MKKLFTFIAALMAVVAINATQVTLNPASMPQQTTMDAYDQTVNGIRVQISRGVVNNSEMRIYKGQNLTLTAESPISAIVFKCTASGTAQYGPGCFDAQDGYSYEGNKGTWLGSATSVSFATTASQVRASKIVVYLDGEQPKEVPLDTISVSEAIARIEKGETDECYVKGVVAGDPFLLGAIGPVFYMTDIENPNDSLEGYKIGKDANTAYKDVEEMSQDIAMGDTIIIYASGLSKYNDIYETIGGYYFRTTGKSSAIALDWKYGTATRFTDRWQLEIAKVDGDAANIIIMNFAIDKYNSIAGHHYLAQGSSITIDGVETAITSGSVKLTFKEQGGTGLNTYVTKVKAVAGDDIYVLSAEIEFYAQDEEFEEIDLVGDRPFVPTVDGQDVTCEQARSYALSLDAGASSDLTVTVHGFVTDLFSNGVTFWMADQQGTEKVIQAYSSVLPVGVALQNGTEVKVKGKVTNYNGTPEISKGNVEIIEGEIADAEYTIVALNLPTQNRPEAVEIIGSFDNMAGTLMNQLETGWWFVELEAKPSDYFKIRGAGSWDQVIEIYNAENGEWTKIQDGQFQFGKLWTDDSYKGNPCKWIELDWSDNKSFRWTEKPRYKFDISCDNNQGKVYGNSGTYLSGTKLTFSAEANYGYHFVKWSDGNTNSSRTIILSEDMSLTAIFAPNTYTFSVSCDEKYGKVVADNGEYDYLTELSISAEAIYGYHFAKWSDGNTSNPRTIILKQDMNLTAIFAPNTYTIRDNSNQAQGYIAGAGQHEYLAEVTLIARANYGYHFTQWSDGVTESSRKVTVTQDLAFKALFAPNKYTFSVSCDEKFGKVVADNGEYDYLTQLTITANANYGYHFVEWSDGNTSNPRVLTLTEDTELTASFAPNIYTISDNSDKSRGYIANAGVHTYLSEVVLEATPNYGYQFVKWSDGKTNNPRTIIVTQDISLAAEFAIAKYGTCGDNNALIWTFDDKGVLTISGSGALNSNYTFGLEAPESMQKVVIESGVSSVGNGAFKNKTTLNEIAISHGVNTIKAEAFAGCSEVTILTLGANLQSIGANAFDGCKRIDEITVYAERVIDITETTFANIGNKKYVYVYVPEASLRKYQRDDYWSEFDLRVIGATTTTVAEDEVNVEPTTNTADVTWPAVDNAATYELTIKDKSGNVICTLIFNAQGQLTSIAFAAPGRGQYAAQVAGFTFTVTGLDSGSSYSFTMEAKDSEGEVLDTKEGSFTTAETGIATAIDNASVDMKPIKVIRNNQLFLLRGDKTYTVQGQEVR